MRHWLLYRQGEYFIHSGTTMGIIARAVAQASQVLKSIESSSEEKATMELIRTAFEHYQASRKKTANITAEIDT